MLHHRPSTPDPAGTRPSTPGSGRDPGPHLTSGVATSGGSARLTVGTLSGVWPAPCPSASRSLSPPSRPGSVTAPAAVKIDSTSATEAIVPSTTSTSRQRCRDITAPPPDGSLAGGTLPAGRRTVRRLSSGYDALQ